MADNIIGVSECVPRKTSLQRNRSNVPSNTPMEHYKRAIAIPLLDSLLSQMKERFSEDQCHAQGLLHLLPSVIKATTTENEPVDSTLESLLHYKGDLPFPRSLGNELRRWNALWHKKGTEIVSDSTGHLPNNLLLTLGACDRDSFPNIHYLLVMDRIHKYFTSIFEKWLETTIFMMWLSNLKHIPSFSLRLSWWR